MLEAQRLAEAFAGACGENTEEGLAAFKVFAACFKAVPGPLSGTGAARQAAGMIRSSLKKRGISSPPPALDYPCRFLCLLIKRNLFRYSGKIIEEIQGVLDRQKGALPVVLETAFPPEDDFKTALIEKLKGKTGAREIRVSSRIVPGLLGGCRLRIGSESLDASLGTQLRKMAERLAAGTFQGGRGW